MIKIFLLLLVLSFEVMASYDAGRVAYDRGDYTHAYELWLEAAKEPRGSLNDSFQWARSSIEQQRNSQYAIALLFWQGKGVEQDYEQAAKWLKLAIKLEHIKARLKMGFLYLHGKGVEKNEAEARKNFLIAAEHGYVDAQYNIGLMYLIGIGGARSAAEAKYWLKRAALQGDGQAFDELMKFPEYSYKEIYSENVEDQAFERRLKFWAGNNNRSLVKNNKNKKFIQPLPVETKDKNITDETIPLKYGVIQSDHVDAPATDEREGIVLHKPSWLLEQTGKKYAIQVLAMRSLQRLKSSTDGLSADGDWVYYVKQKGMRNYYILLRCCFSDITETNRIRQSFPPEIKKLQSFPVHLKKVLPFVILDPQ